MRPAIAALLGAILCCCLVAVWSADTTATGDGTTQDPKLVAWFENGVPGGAYDKSKEQLLKEVFGEGLKLMVKGSGEKPVEGVLAYQLFMNQRCNLDGDEVSLGALTEIPTNTFEVELGEKASGNVDLPCGPVCLMAVVSHTTETYTKGVARIRANLACPDLEVDLALKFAAASVPNRRKAVKLTEDIVDLFPVFQDVKVVNEGSNAMPQRSKDLKQSVAVFIRPGSITQDDVKNATKSCRQRHMEEYERRTKEDGNKEGETVKKRKRRYADESEGEGDDMGYKMSMMGLDLDTVLGEIYEERNETKMKIDDMPECFNQGLLNKDIVLKDIVIESSETEQQISLAGISLNDVKRKLCNRWDGYDWETDTHNATITVVVDPLRMNNDPNLCNNHLSVDISFKCTDVDMGEFDGNQCEVHIDPLSRGHKACVFMNGDPSVCFDGEEMHRMKQSWCQEFDYYVAMTENLRFRLLKDRFQREAEEKPELCDAVDEEEAADEVKLKKEVEKVTVTEGSVRRKRETGDGLAKLTAMIKEVLDQFEKAESDADVAKNLICKYPKMLFMLNKLKDVKDEAELPMSDYEDAVKKIEQLRSTYGEDIDESECETGGEGGLDSYDPFEEVDLEGKDSEFRKKLKNIRDQKEQEQEKEPAEEDVEEKPDDVVLTDLKQKVEDNNKCPGKTEEISKTDNAKEQSLKLLESNTETKMSEMHTGEKPKSSCGWRKLQQVVKSGAADGINKDINKWAKTGLQEEDYENHKQKLAVIAAEALNKEGVELDTEEKLEAFKTEVKTTMNDALDEEKSRCGATREELVKAANKVKDTYDIFWKIDGGVVSKGESDVLDSAGFGSGVAKGKKVLWRPVVTCTCNKCGGDYSSNPKWGDDSNPYGGMFGSGDGMFGSGDGMFGDDMFKDLEGTFGDLGGFYGDTSKDVKKR